IMESLVKKKQKGAILELKRRHLKKVEICINTPYPAKKIRCISANSSQERVLINSLSGEVKESLFVVNDGIINLTDKLEQREVLVSPAAITPKRKDMAPLPAADQRHPWLRYKVEGYTPAIIHSYEQRLETIWSRPVNRVHVLDFAGLTPEMRQDLAMRLRMVYTGEQGQFILEFLSTCRMSDTIMDLDTADTLCFQLGGFRRRITWRQFILALGLHTEQEMAEISSDRDFLGPAPSYVLIRDPVGRLCHRMIAYSISGRGQAPEKVTDVDLFYLRSMDHGTINVPHLLAQYLFRHAEGRKSGVRLSGGHFIRRLAPHFGLVSDEGLRGLQVVTRELPLIDLHELGRLNICTRYSDTWAWVALGPERQHAAAVGAPKADEAREAAEDVAPEIPRIERLEEEVHDLRRDVMGLRGDVASFTTEQSRVSTWLISCMTQLMDANGQTYQPFDNTLIGSSGLSFRRRVRPRTGEASTSAAPHTDARPDP
ncbi:hypothetical protein Tco_1301892, partial [Tanacetum coccineum]